MLKMNESTSNKFKDIVILLNQHVFFCFRTKITVRIFLLKLQSGLIYIFFSILVNLKHYVRIVSVVVCIYNKCI